MGILSSNNHRNDRGFTLIEITVVIAIIASALTTILYFTTKMMREHKEKKIVLYVDALNEKLSSCKMLEVNGKTMESKFEKKEEVLAFLKTAFLDERLINSMNDSISWNKDEQEFKQDQR